VGIGLTAAAFLAPAPGASSLAGKSILKTTLRSSRVSTGLSSDVRRLTIAPRGLARLGHAARDLAEVRRVAGSRAALAVLRHADGIGDLPYYGRIARVFGERAGGVVTLLGKDAKRAFRVYKASRPAVALILGFAALLVASMVGLLASLSTYASTLLARRFLLRLGRAAM
jgi:hypothetical protein